jgi:hypothetical protein
MESNIFHKIFEIMNCYENLLNNHSQCNNKNKSTDVSNNFMHKEDNFFTFIFKNIHIHKNNQDNKINIENTNNINDTNNIIKNTINNINDNTSNNTTENTTENMNDNKNYNININNNDIPIEKDEIIKSYIKKCYKRIVLKCHPDKNNNPEDNKYFIKCQEYYNNYFLIGLLYIFYLYKLEPPLLCNIIINRILCEIRIIQEKILLFEN